MHRKTCTRCGKDSYSAAVNSNWKCPYCNKDLTNEPAKPAIPNQTERSKQVEQYCQKGSVPEYVKTLMR